ncbi:hypothetical protein [Ligilactobacillus salivarius]|uniref:hypothetical protein n=1 Tax=Ligilactobacillus salivarius TaxID=1624 RepID=UPI0009DAB3AC|nr:hypothetical protein [Ligilactobacillus salivarius]OQR18779.1 hypothetical protein B6U39_09225 [Ligilactobacillus salivarius]
MEYVELYEKVKQLAKDKGLDKVDPYTQYIKMTKEQGNLAHELLNFDMNAKPHVHDSLGSYQVELIVYCLIRGIDLIEIIEEENKLWNRFFTTNVYLLEMGNVNYYADPFTLVVYNSSQIISAYNNKDSVEEYCAIGNTLRSLNCVAMEHRTSLEKTLETAYNKLK